MSRLMRWTTRHPRRGMTLVEIMIALVLLGIVSGVLMRVILRQQRFYQGTREIITGRGELRQATAVLPLDLRSLSSVGSDILAVSDSSIEFRMNVGTAVVCEVIGGDQVALPPLTLASGQTLTAWYGGAKPDGNVTVWIYNDSSSVGNEDDRWQRFRLKDIHNDATKCPGPPMWVSDLGTDRPVLELSSSDPNDPVTGGPLSQYIAVGAPVRITRHVQYVLYRESDGQYYLGYSEFDRGLGTFKKLEPVSGPYDAKGSPSGVVFRYYTVDGTEVSTGADSASRASIARVDLIVRNRTNSQIQVDGIQAGARQQYRDSLAVSVMLRNRT